MMENGEETRSNRSEPTEEWSAGRTFNHPDVRNGLRLVVLAALANVATCVIAIYYFS